MALCGTNSRSLDSNGHFSNVSAIPASPTRRAAVYRCSGCGNEVAYDALAALCQCSDECYGDAWPLPTSCSEGKPFESRFGTA